MCEEKEVEVTCWGCRCEPFALPGPSRPGCEHSVEVCPSCPEEVQAGQASKDGVCSQPRKFLWRDWIPNPQATVFTKKKLLKRVVKQKVPSYRWVVEDLCAPCASAEPPTTPGPAPAAGSILEPRSAAGPRNPFSDELR